MVDRDSTPGRTFILYYTETFCAPTETFVYRVARCMERYEPIIYTHKLQNADQFPRDGFQIVETPTPFAASKPVRILKRIVNGLRYGLWVSDILSPGSLLTLHRHVKFDAILAHFGNLGIRILPASLKLGLPLIVNYHGCDLTNWTREPTYRKNLNRLFAQAALHLVPSHSLADHLELLGCPANKIVVMYNPTPLPELFDQKPPGATFIHVGRLVEKKGILHTIEAFASVHEQHSRSRLIIIGDGPLHGAAVALVSRLGLDAHVVFRGLCTYPEVEATLLSSDFMVLHCRRAENGDEEGVPNAIREAMACGLPVVSTHHAGIPEVVLHGTTGLLVEENDVHAMASAMIQLIESPELREQMGMAGRQRIEDHFSMTATRDVFEAALDPLLNRNHES